MKEKRIEIALEIARVFIFGSGWRNHSAWCFACETYVPMVSVSMAAELDKTNPAEIFRRVENADLHHKVTDDGALLVCFSSLLDTEQELDKKHLPFDFSKAEQTDIHNLREQFQTPNKISRKGEQG